MRRRDVCVLASGGADSNVLIGLCLRRYRKVFPLYIRCGYIWEEAELSWLKRYLSALKGKRPSRLTVLKLPVADVSRDWGLTGRRTPGRASRDEAVWLPGRNLLLLARASVFCALRGIQVIAIGTLAGNPFPDSVRAFFDQFSRLASRALDFRLRIWAPFAGLRKQEVLEVGQGLPLHLSFSCLAPRGIKPCGRCNKCAEWERARVF